MIAMNKQVLRRHLRSLHEGDAARNLQSRSICQHILNSNEYRQARVIGGYMPMPLEADITPVMLSALQEGKTLALPLCAEVPHMTLRQVTRLDELHEGRYGLLEPSAVAPIIPVEDVDLLLVPLEGIDRDGFRLGKGGGYYDHLLHQQNIMTIGCVLSWQWVDAVPREEWDRPLTAAADQTGFHDFRQ